MTDLMELASRVEAGEGPDRELDAAIACVIGRPLGNIEHWLHGDDISYQPTAHGYYVAVIPTENGDTRTSETFKAEAFTASLDAAMTLIPGDEMWDVSRESAETYTADLTCFYRGIVDYEPDADKVPFGRAKSPALALTAACLRARAHQGAAHVD